MCPNHPQQFVVSIELDCIPAADAQFSAHSLIQTSPHLVPAQDWKLVTSISVTERVKLWDQFEKPVDHETVKTEFMRKVHCKNPPFRVKLKPKPRHCAEIPPMVEFHYKNPPALLPSLRDVLRCERVYREHGLPNIKPTEDLATYDALQQEIRAANEKTAALDQSDAVDNENEPGATDGEEGSADGGADNQVCDLDTIEEPAECAQTIDLDESMADVQGDEYSGIVQALADSQTPIKSDEKTIQKLENRANLLNESSAMSVVELISNAAEAVDDQCLEESEEPVANMTCMNEENPSSCDSLQLSDNLLKVKLEMDMVDGAIAPEAIDEQLNGLNIEVIKRLAFAQLQQILNESPAVVATRQRDTTNAAIRDELTEKPVKLKLPSQMLSPDDIAAIAEQFALLASPEQNESTDEAYAGVAQPIEPVPVLNGDCFIRTNHLDGIADDGERALAIARRLERPLRESKIRARAVLTPVGDILAGRRWYTNSHVDNSIFMRYRSMVIGSGLGCDFQLTDTHNCARVSKHHATIFYDEVTGSNWLIVKLYLKSDRDLCPVSDNQIV